MLPEVKLDNSGFAEISRKARSQIAGIYPEWTDYNYHDPGITFLELFAFLKEAQQFYMDQVGDRTRKQFLNLLGARPAGRRSSSLEALAETEGPLSLPAGTKFYAGETCFETETEECLPGPVIEALMVKEAGKPAFVCSLGETGESAPFFPFGRRTAEGNEFLLCLSSPLEAGKTYRLSLDLEDQGPVRRNPFQEGEAFDPLSEVKLFYSCGGGYAPLSFEDHTRGFLTGGHVCFSLPAPMEEREEEGRRGYFFKFLLAEDDLDTAPVLTGIGFNRIHLVQRDTGAAFLPAGQAEAWGGEENLAEYYCLEGEEYLVPSDRHEGQMAAVYTAEGYRKRELCQGTGFPNQDWDTGIRGLKKDSLVVAAESLERPGRLRIWTQVEDFFASSPEDCHYRAEEESGHIFFGDGIHGQMPETRVYLLAFCSCRDERGNLTSGKRLSGRIPAVTLKDGTGGRGPESVSQAFDRIRRELKTPDRAVTAEDYESFVKAAPGLRIRDCKVLLGEEMEDRAGENQVRIAVWPWAQTATPPLTEAYRSNIVRWLDGKRLIGSSVRLYSPEYIETEVYAEVELYPQYLSGEGKVEQEIRSFFAGLSGFGQTVSYGSLFGLIDGMEEVSQVRMLSVNARGNRISRNRSGDVLLPPMGVLILKAVECVVVNH